MKASQSSTRYVPLIAFLLTVLFGGGNAVAVRITVAELTPFWGAALRFLITGGIFWVIALFQRPPLPRGRALLGILLYGLLQFGASYALIYWGIRSISAGLTQVILSLTPLFTFFFAFFHGMEVFRWRGLLGAFLAFCGILLAFVQPQGGSMPLLPLLAVVGSAACFAEATIIIKNLPRISPVITNSLAMTFGGGLLLLMSFLVGEPWQMPTLPATWGAIAYLVIFGSLIVFYLFILVARSWTASATSYVLVLMPFVTVIVAYWLTGEEITWAFGLGGVLVLVGVWVGALSNSKPEV